MTRTSARFATEVYVLKSLCVYCGSSPGADPAFAHAARAVGRLVAESGRTLVFGGGRVGLMGVVADAALSAGGKVIGVIPQALMTKEVAHRGLTELHVVASMHERKAMMADLSDAFLALPGGIGTLEELFETWTWGQLGLHAKPFGLLDVDGFYGPLLEFLDLQVEQRFVRPEHRALLCVGREPREVLAQLAEFQPMQAPKWIDRTET
ncbi:MAG: TIGR00730 family Rossman fold protein [Planctomycetes bacterium]|nr:TIGR00730 family Rossman fold protein [Planctomycetota bacterium]